jgi:hypothetical protein
MCLRKHVEKRIKLEVESLYYSDVLCLLTRLMIVVMGIEI